MHLLALLLVPVLVGLVGYQVGKRWISRVQAIGQVVVVSALMGVGYELTRWAGVQDYEVWNGRIASKDAGTSGCCHSYSCNCHDVCSTDSDGRQTCRRECDTCYEHTADDWYNATSTNGEVVYSSGCHPPGSAAPYGWSAIRIGEATAWEHRFTNYVLADPDALLDRDPALARFADRLPNYPRPIGWTADRFLLYGLQSPELRRWNDALAELNADLGAQKQVNVLVVVAPEADPAWFDALTVHWLGGKKNDVVLTVGAPAFPKIAWARVMGWNQATGAEDEFKGSLAWRVEQLHTFDGDRVLAILRDEVSRKWERRPFADFEHLMARARPPQTAMIGLSVAGALVSMLWLYVIAGRAKKRGWRG